MPSHRIAPVPTASRPYCLSLCEGPCHEPKPCCPSFHTPCSRVAPIPHGVCSPSSQGAVNPVCSALGYFSLWLGGGWVHCHLQPRIVFLGIDPAKCVHLWTERCAHRCPHDTVCNSQKLEPDQVSADVTRTHKFLFICTVQSSLQ